MGGDLKLQLGATRKEVNIISIYPNRMKNYIPNNFEE